MGYELHRRLRTLAPPPLVMREGTGAPAAPSGSFDGAGMEAALADLAEQESELVAGEEMEEFKEEMRARLPRWVAAAWAHALARMS